MRVLHLFRFERLRDGGSLCVSFQADDGCEYWVVFPIVERPSESRHHGEPVLVNRTTGIEVELSRAGARQWLDRLTPHIRQRLDRVDASRDEEGAIRSEMLALCQESLRQ